MSTQECANLRPWLHFGSAFRNSDVLLPQVRVMPTFDYLKCLRQWYLLPNITECTEWELPYHDHSDHLSWSRFVTPRIIWRGNDYNFLPTIGPEHFLGKYEVPQVPFRPRLVAVMMNSSFFRRTVRNAGYP
jgi:hypothetical protein